MAVSTAIYNFLIHIIVRHYCVGIPISLCIKIIHNFTEITVNIIVCQILFFCFRNFWHWVAIAKERINLSASHTYGTECASTGHSAGTFKNSVF